MGNAECGGKGLGTSETVSPDCECIQTNNHQINIDGETLKKIFYKPLII